MSDALDLTPRPGAAPWAARIAAQTALEVRSVLRNGEQLLLTVLIPLLVLVGLTLVPVDLATDAASRAERVAVVLPGVLALAVLSTAFTGLAIGTGFERRYGVLKLLGATPLSRVGLVAAKAAAVLVVEVGQVVLLLATALLLGWSPAGSVVAAACLLVLGTAAFAGLGLLMAGTLRAEATLAAANLVYLLLLAGGASIVPVDRYPDGLQPVLELLPSAALGEGLRTALAAGAGVGDVLPELLVLLVWAVGAVGLAGRFFRWE